MNIQFSLLSQSAISFIKEKNLPSLTKQQKIIVTISVLAFGLLATYYTFRHFCLKNRKMQRRKSSPLLQKKEEKSNSSPKIEELKGVVKSSSPSKLKDIKTLVDGSKAEGSFDDQGNGQGIVTRLNGNKEEGEFQNGQLHGQGKLITGSATESGQFNQGILVKGKKEADETIYEGSFNQAGELHGQGKITFFNDEILTGEFNDGKFIKGTRIKPKGPTYEGEFTNETFIPVLNGQGKMTDTNGTVYEGLFQKNELVKGTRTNPDGTKFEGNFKLLALSGQGTMTSKDGVFVGEFQQGRLIKGQKKFTDGTIWEGEFDSLGELIGNGKIISSKGVIMEGSFKGNTLLKGKFIDGSKETPVEFYPLKEKQ